MKFFFVIILSISYSISADLKPIFCHSKNYNMIWRIPCADKIAIFFYNDYWYLMVDKPIAQDQLQGNDIILDPTITHKDPYVLIQFKLPAFVKIIPQKTKNGWDLMLVYADASTISNFENQNIYKHKDFDTVVNFSLDGKTFSVIPLNYPARNTWEKMGDLKSVLCIQGGAFDGVLPRIKKEKEIFIPFFFKNYPNISADRKKFLKSLKNKLPPYTAEDDITRAWFLTTNVEIIEAHEVLISISKRTPSITNNQNYLSILSMVLFLNQRYKEAIDEIEKIKNPNHEIQFLKMLCYVALGNVDMIIFAENEIKAMISSYPKLLKERILINVLPFFAAAGSIKNVEFFTSPSNSYSNFLKILSSVYHQMLRVALSKTSFDDAQKEYKKLESSNVTYPFVNAIATCESIMFNVEKNTIELGHAISKLDRTRFLYRSESIEYRITMLLVKLLCEQKEYVRSLKLMENMHKKYPVRSSVECLLLQMEKMLEMFLENKDGPIKIIAAFELFQYLIRNNLIHKKLSLKIIDILLEIDLLDAAADFLTKLSIREKNLQQKQDLLLKTASIHIKNQKYDFAIVTLDALPKPLDDNRMSQKIYMHSIALYKSGKINEAKSILMSSSNKNHLVILANFLMQEENWQDSFSILSLIKSMLKPSDPIYKSIVENLTISAYLSNKQDVIKTHSILNKYICEEINLTSMKESREFISKTLNNVDALNDTVNRMETFGFIYEREENPL